jgi:hypothetical protein
MPQTQTDAGVVNGQLLFWRLNSEHLICSILRQRDGRDIDPNFVGLLEKAGALLIFLHKLSGNLVFLWFIPPITDRVLLPLN